MQLAGDAQRLVVESTRLDVVALLLAGEPEQRQRPGRAPWVRDLATLRQSVPGQPGGGGMIALGLSDKRQAQRRRRDTKRIVEQPADGEGLFVERTSRRLVAQFSHRVTLIIERVGNA